MSFDNQELVRLLKALRTRAGLSQAETARRADLSKANYNRVEQGKRGIAVESLARVLDVLGVDLLDPLRRAAGEGEPERKREEPLGRDEAEGSVEDLSVAIKRELERLRERVERLEEQGRESAAHHP